MTDSMKFGPEWLRNLSTDSTTNSTSIGAGGGSGNSSSNLHSSLSSLNIGVSSNYHHGNSTINVHLPGQQPRNLFPQFRYGREELLSLFDKSCILPEILPGYKKLFVEKVQVPLALTPTTDEEVFAQGAAPAAQRTAWMRRSPVGFPPSTRGTGRGGGSVDRGRMRGKSVYHPVYQRGVTANLTMFDDARAPSIKPERAWAERNGAGDALGPECGGFVSAVVASDWNGTPASSPRKEFSSHSRNMENWRKNRTEDGSGDAPPSSSIVGVDGWRGGSTSFGTTHRWGRSSSWRDDDAAATTNAEAYAGGGGITMQRSYSTISTTVSDRASYGGSSSISKSSSLSSATGYAVGSNQIPGRQICSNSVSAGVSGRHPQWLNSTVDAADDLPEWAMENPSDSGGTFDASGAFHGSAEDNEPLYTGKDYETYIHSDKKSSSSDESSQSSTKINSNEEDVCSQNHEEDAGREKSSESTASIQQQNEILDSATTIDPDIKENQKQQDKNHETLISSIRSDKLNESPNEAVEENKAPVEQVQAKPTAISSIPSQTTTAQQQLPNLRTTNSHSELSDRMQEVADDMVEKLIMDDDSSVATINHNVNKNANPIGSSVAASNMQPNAFVVPAVAAILKQTAAGQQLTSTTSPLPTMSASHKVMPVFGGGLVVDHATMQQHHMQQQQLAAASAAASLQSTMNTTTSVDLWYYRDPQSKVQGPFTAIEMTEWYRAGYFDENLFVRRVCDTSFRALGELIKLCHGNMPFTHTHMIPMGLDIVNMVPSNVAAAIRQAREKQQLPQAINEFVGLNQQQQQQQHQEQREELKGNVTAAADSLSAAIKNLINPVDMSHILNMHFQMLQEQYLRHQEMMVLAEYSTKECFQRLTPSEREAVVRQKVQMLGLPEYLTSLAGLSNSLATLNPTAGNQLYDVIAECSKKEQHHFGSGASQQSQTHQQPQQLTSITNSFLDHEDFLLNSQKHQQTPFANDPYSAVLNNENGVGASNDDISTHELINDFNLRMLLRGNTINASQAQPQQQKTPSADYSRAATASNDFLSQQQQLIVAAASQSPALQMWMPQLPVANKCQQHKPQFLTQQPVTQTPATNQWTGNPLVHLANTAIPSAAALPSKSMPASMWDVLPLEKLPNPHHFQTNVLNFDVQPQNQQQQLNAPADGHKQQPNQAPVETDNFHINHTRISPLNAPSHETSLINTASPTQQLGSCSNKSRKENQCEKQNLQQHQATAPSNKRSSSKAQTVPSLRKEGKVEESTINNKKQTEEERRREIAEEKRRQKEEKKRQQAEEEKRRLQVIEDEKHRQQLEEKERQQQIQAQRRKAMLGTAAAAAAAVGTTANSKSNNQQRVQSSVAPWSAQNTAIFGNTGPSLAEIQKAERRERRADQQRQMGILEKQIRANTAANAENSDAFLKWNASSVPVKSFAEIQAEEAKHLAAEQLEIQRRKEQEQAASLVANIGSAGVGNAVGSGVSSTTISAIWSGSKVWGTTSNAGFWEESVKFSAALNANKNNGAAAAVSATTVRSQQPAAQQKVQTTSSQQSGSVTTSNRSLTKSQTVSTMQNASSSSSGSTNKNQQHSVSASTIKQSHKQQPQKPNPEKKGNGKSQNSSQASNNNAAASYSSSAYKKDDYQNEFTGWCMKILGGMNTKVDVPTFVTFLQDLESPYEVKDYVRMYLGENKEYTEFAKQFLERRSKYKNLQRAQNAHNDDMCKPAPAITPSGNDFLDYKGKQKKVKKSKMTKLDARILGFSVTAAEGRINVGDRDYVDAP